MGGRAGGGASVEWGKEKRRPYHFNRHLSQAAQKTLRAEEEAIRRQRVEYGMVMDENGNVIWKGTDNRQGTSWLVPPIYQGQMPKTE